MSATGFTTIKSLQLLRCIAVSLVILAHAIDSSQNFGRSYIARLGHFENFGAIGVDIFFVISGCVMTIITASSTTSPQKFILRRCTKILPLYWGLSLFCWCISFTRFWPAVKSAEILQTVTVIPIFESGYAAGAILFLGWTLSFEFLFYFVFTIALILNRKNSAASVFCILGLLVCTGFVFSKNISGQFKFFTNPIILEFLLGCICGEIYLSSFVWPKSLSYTLFLISLIVMGLSVYFGFGSISEMNFTWDGSLSLQRVLRWGVPSFLLVISILMLEKKRDLKAPVIFLEAGNSSYSAYLTHIFVIMLVTSIWHRMGFKAPDLFIPIAFLLSIISAWFVYLFFEKPITGYLNKKINIS